METVLLRGWEHQQNIPADVENSQLSVFVGKAKLRAQLYLSGHGSIVAIVRLCVLSL